MFLSCTRAQREDTHRDHLDMALFELSLYTVEVVCVEVILVVCLNDIVVFMRTCSLFDRCRVFFCSVLF